MARSLWQQWRDGPGGRWTKRVRWYRGPGIDRLVFLDQQREANRFYQTKEDAQHDWDAFIGGWSVKEIIDNGKGF